MKEPIVRLAPAVNSLGCHLLWQDGESLAQTLMRAYQIVDRDTKINGHWTKLAPDFSRPSQNYPKY